MALLEHDISFCARAQAKPGNRAGRVAIELQARGLRTRPPLVVEPDLEPVIVYRCDLKNWFLLDAHLKTVVDDRKLVGGVELGGEEATGKLSKLGE